MAGTPIPIRLTKEQIARIDAVSLKLGTPRTGVIKMCLLAFLQRFEHEGLALLPPDWEARLQDLDGRTHRYGPSGAGHRAKPAAKPAAKPKKKPSKKPAGAA